MDKRLEIYGSIFLTSFIFFNITKSIYSINYKVNLLEHKIITIKEKISDLEIFKAKVYNNEVIPGRRVWDELDIDEDEDYEID